MTTNEDDLRFLTDNVRAALSAADRLELWDVAASLDRALVLLSGTGIVPPGDHDISTDTSH